MKKLALQISPEAKSAYFADDIAVAQHELRAVMGEMPATLRTAGPLAFFEIDVETADDPSVQRLLRLSFAQGLYGVEGEALRPLDHRAAFPLHDDFVFGSKFRGKTNERLTQLLINLGLATLGVENGQGLRLLDPMCGRGTTLLWAMQYGFKAVGIEQDPSAFDDVWRHLKKWSKIHRQKHSLEKGTLSNIAKQPPKDPKAPKAPKIPKGTGQFLQFDAADRTLRLIIGDTRQADQIFPKERFDMLVCDLPYGVQHTADESTRNPLGLIAQCAGVWRGCLKKNAAVVLAFNANNPKRDALIAAFARTGLEAQPFSAPHRMSESIVRDVVVFKAES